MNRETRERNSTHLSYIEVVGSRKVEIPIEIRRLSDFFGPPNEKSLVKRGGKAKCETKIDEK